MTPPPNAPSPRSGLWRIALVLAVFIGLYGVAALTGATEYFTRERISTLIENAGVWGWFLFVAVFALGELIHIPGFVFVGAVTLVYPPWIGIPLSYVGAVISVCISYWVVRTFGGGALHGIQHPRLQRILGRLEQSPLQTVVILRLLLWMAPPLNYALAMTSIRSRDYVLGSAIGLLLPLIGVAAFFYWAAEFF